MHPLVRILRVALPIVFVAFVALIIASYTRAQFAQRKSEPEPITGIRPGDRASLVMEAFEDTHSVGGRLVSRIRASRTIGFESGWFALESIELSIYSDKGIEYRVTAGQAQFNPETKEAEAVGGVTVSSSEGLSISTQRVRFDGEHVANRLPVDFTVGGWVGHAGGIRLRVADETLYLLDGVKASFDDQNPQQKVDLVADSATSYQRSGDLVLEGNVSVTRPSEVLMADVLRVGTAPDTRQLTGVAGEGNVLIRFRKGSSLVGHADGVGGAGETRIDAERFTGEVGEHAVLSALTIMGEKLPVRVVMQTIPRREITAKTVRAEMTPAGTVESLHASGKASIQELGSAPRVIESDEIRAAFDPETGDPTGAVFNGNVRFRDREGEGRAPRAVYDMKSDKVTLATVDGEAPTLQARGSLIKASSIEYSPRGGTMWGRGQVVVRYNPASEGGSVDNVLFGESDEPVFVNADMVVGIRSSRVVTFSGNVRAWQAASSVFADELQVLRDGEEISGAGSVRVVVRQPAADGSVQSINARSETLVARRDAGRVEFDGGVQIEEAGRTLEAARSVFVFDRNNRIDRMESTGDVVLTELATGRSAKGDLAIYRVPQRTVSITGNPALLVDTAGEMRGSEIRFDTASQKVEVIGGEATYNPEPK